MTVTAAVTQLITADAAVSPSLGAPGVYFAPASAVDGLEVETMDAAAFVGVAPRGPAWVVTTDPETGSDFRARSVARAVDSWDDFVELYGGIEGDLQLARAVSAYFAQGARRAYVVRVVRRPAPDDRPGPDDRPPGCAVHEIKVGADADAPTWLTVIASNEGAWGNLLGARATFTHQRLGLVGPSTREADDHPWELHLPRAALVTRGATLRLRPTDTVAPPQYAVVEDVFRDPHPVDRDRPITAILAGGVRLTSEVTAEVVEVTIAVTDNDRSRRRGEEHPGLGLDRTHPRYLGSVINAQSRLLQVLGGPDPALLDEAVRAGRLDSSLSTVEALHGADGWADITPEDHFPEAELAGSGGIDALAAADEVATIVAPDLYWPPAPRPERLDLPAPAARSDFVSCPDRPAARSAVPPLDLGSRPVLDPRDPTDRATIVEHQRRLVGAAERMHRIALLDVPPGLTNAQIQAWRAQFDSAFGAAYHPWLELPAPFGRTLPLVPSAVAAGIIARTELASGLARGPANAVATGVVDVDAIVSAEDHADLHRLGVNVFSVDTDGVCLSAARTLSSDSYWRQLSVRRLLLAIERSVHHQLQWCVFENNDDLLRDNVRTQLNAMMAVLFAQGCFAGATPEESWFVRVAPAADAAGEQDAGQLIADIGVAPAEPLEFIVVRVAVQAEGEVKSSFVVGEVSARG